MADVERCLRGGRLNSREMLGSRQVCGLFGNRVLVFEISLSMPPICTVPDVMTKPQCHSHPESEVAFLEPNLQQRVFE